MDDLPMTVLSTRIVQYVSMGVHAQVTVANTPDNSHLDDISSDEESTLCGGGGRGVSTRCGTRPVFPWRMDRSEFPHASHATGEGHGASHLEEHACAALVRMRAWPATDTPRPGDSVMSGACTRCAQRNRTCTTNEWMARAGVWDTSRSRDTCWGLTARLAGAFSGLSEPGRKRGS
jgi:hypothetical protein